MMNHIFPTNTKNVSKILMLIKKKSVDFFVCMEYKMLMISMFN